MTARANRIVALALAVGIVLGGCSSDSDDSAATTSQSTTTAAPGSSGGGSGACLLTDAEMSKLLGAEVTSEDLAASTSCDYSLAGSKDKDAVEIVTLEPAEFESQKAAQGEKVSVDGIGTEAYRLVVPDGTGIDLLCVKAEGNLRFCVQVFSENLPGMADSEALTNAIATKIAG